MAPYEIARCDKADLDDLGKLMMKWDDEMVAPEQWLVNQMSTIPKKRRCRTVAAMATGWRSNTTLGADEYGAWNKGMSHDGDSAKPDTPCLRAAERRMIDMEILNMSGFRTLAILWDFVKFFDRSQYDVLKTESESQ